jgi:endonuclease/exonuclease/phosphatase family metal-dependent hydrolase
MRARWVLALGVVLAFGVRAVACKDRTPPLRFATFNIEDFPKDRRQVEGAFDEIARLDASFIAVQEIVDPALFTAEAANRLGGAWQFVAEPTTPATQLHPTHHLGVLFDRRVWTLVDHRLHDETRLGSTHKPTLEVRLRPASGGDVLRLLVVHLKAGGDNAEIRARQHRALAQIIEYEPDVHTIVLGDFNATGEPDRASLSELGQRAHLWWATQQLACSAFWSRDDGCFRSRLDHVLMWRTPDTVEAAGGCATHGCEWEESCPTYSEHVSDHCPVVVTMHE